MKLAALCFTPREKEKPINVMFKVQEVILENYSITEQQRTRTNENSERTETHTNQTGVRSVKTSAQINTKG